MDIKSPRFLVILAITFIILFLMNYIGNNQPDRIQQGLMTAVAGSIGLTIRMWSVHRNSKDDTHHDFD